MRVGESQARAASKLLRLRLAGSAWLALGAIGAGVVAMGLVRGPAPVSSVVGADYPGGLLFLMALCLAGLAAGITVLNYSRWARVVLLAISGPLLLLSFNLSILAGAGYSGRELDIVGTAVFWALGLTAVTSLYSIVATLTTFSGKQR
jgi:hypothetical protein